MDPVIERNLWSTNYWMYPEPCFNTKPILCLISTDKTDEGHTADFFKWAKRWTEEHKTTVRHCDCNLKHTTRDVDIKEIYEQMKNHDQKS